MESKLSMEEQFSNRLVNWLSEKVTLSEIEYAKISYGLSVLMINLVKVILIYFISFLLGTFGTTFFVHIPFCIIRKYGRGFHAKSSFNCGLVGVVCFSFIPWIFKIYGLGISNTHVILVGLICTVILFFRVPGDTAKNQVEDIKKRRVLKVKAIGMNVILFSIILLNFNYSEKLIISTGLLIAAILTLPLEKILWRKEK